MLARYAAILFASAVTLSATAAAQEMNRSKASGADPDTSPPRYTRTLADILGLNDADHGGGPADGAWSGRSPESRLAEGFRLGIEQRMRFEYRDDDYRRAELTSDRQWLLRTRGFLGLERVLDPIRVGFEFQDSRQFGSRFPETPQDVDENEILQAYLELYLADLLGPGKPVRLQAGRLSFDLVDRKLVGRNGWRTTTNAFDGFRLQLGTPGDEWDVDIIALQPVERLMRRRDRADENRWLFGVAGSWRGWKSIGAIQPYYFVLDDHKEQEGGLNREIHTVGVHAFSPIGRTRFDYDVDVAVQFGKNGKGRHCAWAGSWEVGYEFDHPWKPRASFMFAYASGDRDPDDADRDRFDRMFGAGHYWSMSDTVVWENQIYPRLRLQLRPSTEWEFDIRYGAYWLASIDDAWGTTGRRDATRSGSTFAGQEIEFRVVRQFGPRFFIEVGYSHLFGGDLQRNFESREDSNFFYVQTIWRL
jgi:hypothetical protein